MSKSGNLLLCAAVAGLVPGPLGAQGRLGLLQPGYYVCALPGSAAGAAWVEEPSRDFTVTGSSTYSSPRGSGTYLLEGRRLTFTRGPHKGMVMNVTGAGLLQEIGADGKLGRLRCHRTKHAE